MGSQLHLDAIVQTLNASKPRAKTDLFVNRFLNGSLKFLDIPQVCREVMSRHAFREDPSLEELLAADRWARQEVVRLGSQ